MVVSHDQNCDRLNIFDSCVDTFPAPIYGAFFTVLPREGRSVWRGKDSVGRGGWGILWPTRVGGVVNEWRWWSILMYFNWTDEVKLCLVSDSWRDIRCWSWLIYVLFIGGLCDDSQSQFPWTFGWAAEVRSSPCFCEVEFFINTTTAVHVSFWGVDAFGLTTLLNKIKLTLLSSGNSNTRWS